MFKLSKKELKTITGFFLIWRFLLFLVAFLAPNFLAYRPSFPYAQTLSQYKVPAWIYSFANFDGIHYLTIAQKGYFGTGLIQAFFPFYSILIKILTIFSQNYLISSLLISNIFAYLFILAFYSLVKQEFKDKVNREAREGALGQKIAKLSLIVLLSFPTSFYLGASYSESLFLFLTISSLLLIKKENWLLASVFAALASATRLVGIFLFPLLLVELWQAKTSKKDKNYLELTQKFIKKYWHLILTTLISTLGLVGYMLYLKIRFDDPLYFLHVQSEFGAGRQESIILYPQVIYRYIKILLTARPFDFKYFSYVQDFISSTIFLLILLFSYKKVKSSYLVFSLLAFFLPTLTGTFSSMPRYILVCFPIFIYLARFFTKRKLAWYLYLTISTILLIINTMLFVQGYWVA